jgi:D-glycero-D-manno-heptose 1,7-bisphosphate phosphatase
VDERAAEPRGGGGGAVFLDRDDTLIANRTVTASTAHPGDLFDPALVQLLPGAAAGCRLLSEAGFALVVVSNQGAVARGRCSIEEVEATNDRVRELLAREGVSLAGIYYCPHHPKGTVAPWNAEHPWRKPAPGMLLAAAEDLRLDLGRSWMIGDAERDIEAALAAGIPARRAILVGAAPGPEGVRRCEDVLAAARAIVGQRAN